MATVSRHQTETAVAGFSQVMSLTSVSSHLSRRGSFVRLTGAQLSPRGLVVRRGQVEGVVFAVCSVSKVRLQSWAGLAAVHAVHLYQHGCFRTRCWLPPLRSISRKEKERDIKQG